MFPRILSSTEWKTVEKGVIQEPINAFLNDIYNTAEIVKAGIVLGI